MPADAVIAALVGALIGALIVVAARGRATADTTTASASTSSQRPVSSSDPGGAPGDDVGDTLRAGVDRLSLGVVIGDADGGVVYRNIAASALTGTHAGVIIEEHVEKALARARGGQRVDEELVLHGPPPLSLRLSAEPMPNGFSVATIEDVSERNRIDAMRTDFVANISHELKTPIGAIAVLAEALLGEPNHDVVERIAARMVDEAHRAVNSIDDLLELSRIESGPLGHDVLDLREVVEAATSRGRGVGDSTGVTVTTIDSGESLMLRADRRQIESAIGNLVENAVKYSDRNGVVEVRTRVGERSIEVAVVDRGDGIPHRDLDRIFERFYRVDRARSRETGGSGLGLSIVRHVAANHGGTVLVSSTEGEGSTFVLQLPAALLVDNASAEPSIAATEAFEEHQP